MVLFGCPTPLRERGRIAGGAITSLRPYTQRPEGFNVINLTVSNVTQARILSVEDRFPAQGYGARNAIHWPITIL